MGRKQLNGYEAMRIDAIKHALLDGRSTPDNGFHVDEWYVDTAVELPVQGKALCWVYGRNTPKIRPDENVHDYLARVFNGGFQVRPRGSELVAGSGSNLTLFFDLEENRTGEVNLGSLLDGESDLDGGQLSTPVTLHTYDVRYNRFVGREVLTNREIYGPFTPVDRIHIGGNP